MNIYKCWDEIDKLNAKKDLSLILKIIDNNLGYFFDASKDEKSLSQLGSDQKKRAEIDRVTFVKNLSEIFKEINEFERRSFLLSIYVAYNKSLNRDIDKCTYILFPMHGQEKNMQII